MRNLLHFLRDLRNAAFSAFADQCRAVNHAIEAGQDDLCDVARAVGVLNEADETWGPGDDESIDVDPVPGALDRHIASTIPGDAPIQEAVVDAMHGPALHRFADDVEAWLAARTEGAS